MDKIDLGKPVKLSQKECPCYESDTDVVLDLQNYPITELYRPITNEDEPYGFIDQTARFCRNCSHLFLEKILDPEIIYSDTNYMTSTVSRKGAARAIFKKLGDLGFKDIYLPTIGC